MSTKNEYRLSEERLDNIIQLLKENSISVSAQLNGDFSPKRPADLQYKGDNLSVRDEIIKRFFKSDLASVRRFRKESQQSPGQEAWYYAFGAETLVFDGNMLLYENRDVQEDGIKPSLEEARKACVNLMKRINPNFIEQNYIMESESQENSVTITYYEKLDELPVLDLYMSFVVYDKGIAEGNMYLGEIEVTGEKREEIFPVDLVLFGIEEELQNRGCTAVESVSMAYKRLENEDNVWGQQIVPAYKIQGQGLDGTIFVNAYTNEILR